MANEYNKTLPLQRLIARPKSIKVQQFLNYCLCHQCFAFFPPLLKMKGTFLRGYCTSYPQISMFCARSQNYQYFFEE